MKTMKKILSLALAGVMALALLTGCGTGGSASHKSIAKAMADYENGIDRKTTITYTSSAVLDAKLQEQAKKPGFEDVVKAVYNGQTPTILTGVVVPNDMVVYLYCGKYDKDAGKQAINLNARAPVCANTYSGTAPSLADERQIGLITTSFTDATTGEKVKVRFAVVVSDKPTPTP